MVGLAAHLKTQNIFGLGIGQGYRGLIPLGVDLGQGYRGGDPQDLRVIQMQEEALQDGPYLGFEGFKKFGQKKIGQLPPQAPGKPGPVIGLLVCRGLQVLAGSLGEIT